MQLWTLLSQYWEISLYCVYTWHFPSTQFLGFSAVLEPCLYPFICSRSVSRRDYCGIWNSYCSFGMEFYSAHNFGKYCVAAFILCDLHYRHGEPSCDRRPTQRLPTKKMVCIVQFWRTLEHFACILWAEAEYYHRYYILWVGNIVSIILSSPHTSINFSVSSSPHNAIIFSIKDAR